MKSIRSSSPSSSSSFTASSKTSAPTGSAPAAFSGSTPSVASRGGASDGAARTGSGRSSDTGSLAPTAVRSSGGTTDLRERPMHEEIAACARELWRKYGCPSGRDEAIWLEAERQLLGVDRDIVRLGQPVLADKLHASEVSSGSASTPGGDRRARGGREAELAEVGGARRR